MKNNKTAFVIYNRVQFLKYRATHPKVKFAVHQTWAYENDVNHFGYVSYNNDQERMFRAIVESANYTLTHTGLDFMIPAGASIQNGRTGFLGDNFCRDGYI